MDPSGSESPECINNFNNVIEIVLNNWTGLKLAIEHGLGGPPAVTLKKLELMIQYLSQVFNSGGPNTEWTSISDYLSDVMDSDFSTVLEDGSSDEVAAHLCQLHELFCAGDSLGLTSAINQLPNKTPISFTFNVRRLQPLAEVPKQDETDEDASTNDGWTLVRKK